MPALFVFLLKVNIALAVFCLGYYLVLRKLTFYTLNRYYFVLGIIFSSAYPFVDVDSFFERHKQLAQIQQVVIELKTPAENLLANAWYWSWAAMLFWIGAAFFAMLLVVQFISLHKIYRNSTPGTLHNYNVRVTDANISPFSFWSSIFINPDNIETADLKNILKHEQVHVKEWHTLDILLAQVSLVFYWFNPSVWFIKKAVSENLEFITDRKILQNGQDSKAYQYSLLHVSLGTNASPNIANHFNFSTLKTRIKMMNAKKSPSITLTRYALLLPLMVTCLCVFSVSKAEIIDQGKVAYNNISSSVKEMAFGYTNEVTVKSRKTQKLPLHLNDTTKKKVKTKEVYLIVPDSAKKIHNFTYTFTTDSAKEIKTADGKVIKSVVVFKTLADDTSKVAKSYVINGKKVGANELKTVKSSTIEGIRVIDANGSDTSLMIKGKVIQIKTKDQ